MLETILNEFISILANSEKSVLACSAKQDPIFVTFFGTIEKIYTFFSASTLWWEELKNVLPLVVKRECETRWNSRAEAT